ncbi:serine hydrolase-like protein [Andrena cerasifolii]|uniref:serine hydrolase-like protein n=1 Tax=Andrena cerasifolii TaxID=2819439 RepID=UPI004037A751
MVGKMERQVTEIKLPMPWGHIAGRVYGPAKDSKILVVHGVLDNSGSFHRLIELLPQNYQYVSIDLPGHGLSSSFPPDVPLVFFNYVYAISLVLDALNWKTCIYLGHSLGGQLGLHFSILFPGRLDKVIAIDGLIPEAINELLPYIRNLYDLNSYAKVPAKLYTRDEIIYALKFKRKEALTTDAAEAIFERAVAKVDNLYKYNRDPKLRYLMCPIFNAQQQQEFFKKLPSPVFAIAATNSGRVKTMARSKHIIQTYCDTKEKFTMIYVKGNHDVHNNYPERVAPHIVKILNNNLPSKL